MTQEALTAELLAMRGLAEGTAQNIDDFVHDLFAERQLLRQVVREYGAKRVELLKQELQARGMTWCTCCSEVIPESEAELLFVEGREEYTHGYEGSYYGFRGFSELQWACSTCRERAADKHGQRGEYDSLAKDQSSFYAFCVEKRDDGYYARKFGDWVKLDDENCKLDEPSSRLVEQLAEEWNLPPRIELVSKWPRSEELIIHERVTMAKAS